MLCINKARSLFDVLYWKEIITLRVFYGSGGCFSGEKTTQNLGDDEQNQQI
ncbi:hypothetical protein ACF3DV_30505 [Chlorogloeopsis fritschii PCC 9212]|uniref:hypothetical protein n=1 Tax=Chlorogloeopsis fritschii TaxID=1124 RepID=UPI000304C796|nr:hypothetical protein [Chlorogloeopsis fritschii]